MKVFVTQDDIRLGVPRSSAACPVGRAIKRATGLPNVHVAVAIKASSESGLTWLWETPPEVLYFISDLDRGIPVKPFEFELTDTESEVPAGR